MHAIAEIHTRGLIRKLGEITLRRGKLLEHKEE